MGATFFCIQCQDSYKSEHTERITKRAEDKKGGKGKDITGRTRGITRSGEGREMGQSTQGKPDRHYRNFQEGKQGI